MDTDWIIRNIQYWEERSRYYMTKMIQETDPDLEEAYKFAMWHSQNEKTKLENALCSR